MEAVAVHDGLPVGVDRRERRACLLDGKVGQRPLHGTLGELKARFQRLQGLDRLGRYRARRCGYGARGGEQQDQNGLHDWLRASADAAVGPAAAAPEAPTSTQAMAVTRRTEFTEGTARSSARESSARSDRTG